MKVKRAREEKNKGKVKKVNQKGYTPLVLGKKIKRRGRERTGRKGKMEVKRAREGEKIREKGKVKKVNQKGYTPLALGKKIKMSGRKKRRKREGERKMGKGRGKIVFTIKFENFHSIINFFLFCFSGLFI